MAYLHCHDCGWSQDDFYHKGYNPAHFLENWDDILFGDRKYQLDQPFPGDSQWIKEYGNITYREVIAQEYEKFAKRIRNMKWTTQEDYDKDRKAGIAECPKCKSKKGFDID